MTQIADLNARLGERTRPTAAQLDLPGAHVRSAVSATLPEAAVLIRVDWTGDPAFPDVHGVFRAAAVSGVGGVGGDAAGSGGARGSDGHLMVDLHTHALRQLSQFLGLRHAWGVGPPRAEPSDSAPRAPRQEG